MKKVFVILFAAAALAGCSPQGSSTGQTSSQTNLNEAAGAGQSNAPSGGSSTNSH